MNHHSRAMNVFFRWVGRPAGRGICRLNQADRRQQSAGKAQSPQQDTGSEVVAKPLKVCIVGSGNWGAVVSKIIGSNVKNTKKFVPTVKMWVFEEGVSGRKLTDITNSDHENIKYLPGHRLPENVVATPSLSQAAQDADLLPHASSFEPSVMRLPT